MIIFSLPVVVCDVIASAAIDVVVDVFVISVDVIVAEVDLIYINVKISVFYCRQDQNHI